MINLDLKRQIKDLNNFAKIRVKCDEQPNNMTFLIEEVI